MLRKLKSLITKISPGSGIGQETMHISKEYIQSLLPSNPVILDCGSHIGMDAIEFSGIEGSTIYAVEAVKEIYDKLVENTKGIPNIKCFNLALSDYNGEADMFISSGESDGSSSLLKPKMHLEDHPEVLFEESKKVKCLTLDQWAKDFEIPRIDLLWLDMQGYEQKMLSASRHILDTVNLIHTEVSVKETYEGVQDYQAFKKFLQTRGFKVLIEAIPKKYDMGNVLLIRNK